METKHCSCGVNGPDQNCKRGSWADRGSYLFKKMEPIVKLATHPAFFNLSSKQREVLWGWFNEAANQYLSHINFSVPLIDYATIPENYKMKKECRTCGRETTWILYNRAGKTILWCGACKEKEDLVIAVRKWKLGKAKGIIPASVYKWVMEWVEAGLSYTELEEKIEYIRMGFDCDEQPWMEYGKVYGIILAEEKSPYKP